MIAEVTSLFLKGVHRDTLWIGKFYFAVTKEIPEANGKAPKLGRRRIDK